METITLRPPRRNGLLFQIGVIFILAALAAVGLQAAADAQIGAAFLVALLPTLVIIGSLLILIYRSYALWSASYTLERDGLRLQWGLRFEDIPMNAIRWVHPASDLNESLPLPWPRWDGAVLGMRHLRNGTPVEFLASQTNGLILIAIVSDGSEHAFAISPLHPDEFLRAYQRQTELGSFASRTPRSLQPTAILANFWPDRRARSLVIGTILINLALLIWVSLIIPAHPVIPFRFNAEGTSLDLVPSVRLMLLPIISTILASVDLLFGLFFYRRPETQIAAYLLWMTGLAASALFLGAVYFIAQAV